MATGFRQCSAIACLFFIKYISTAYAAQNLPSILTVPPLQWLNITGIIQGAPPAAVKYSSIGYDPETSNLIIFGGESSNGIPTAQTYLLNLGTLTWNTPQPQTGLPQGAPPARYMAVSGEDFSSSYRHAHLVMGGRGLTGKALSDVWEFDFINQFWSEVSVTTSGPPARWGASGGRDDTVPPNSSTTSNTFYLSGGTDGTNMYPLSDVWDFTISGTLSSNLANNYTNGAWSHQTVGTAGPGYSVNQASTVVQTNLISVSGCNTTNDSNDSCAQGLSYVLEVGSDMAFLPPSCPVPRYGGSLAPNMNPFSSSYANQVFLVLGTFNSSLWDDQGGLQKGEVAVMDIGTGDWSRVLPAGDPGQDGVQTYPTPREGAVAISYSQALVGSNKGVASDTIVFGGQDESGEYLTEVWILRAYTGSISSSNGSWGAPSGALQTGINANGADVTIQYITQCAVQLAPSSSTSSGSPSTTTTSSPQSYQSYDVSVAHKLLAPLSLAILLPSLLLLRLALPPAQTHRPTDRNLALFYLSAIVALAAYGAGVGGLVLSFTTISSTTTIMKRSTSHTVLQTGHGVVGLALFIGLYVMMPFLYLCSLCCLSSRPPKEVNPETITSRANSTDTAEKLAAYNAAQHSHYPPSPHSPRTRLHSWGGSSFLLGRRSREGRTSTDSESMHSSGPQRAFEVVNRPARIRRSSTNGLAYPNTDVYQRVPVAPRSLGDVDWLDRRRSLNAVNELDLVSGHGQRGLINSSTPNTAEMLSTRALVPTPTFAPVTHELPSLFEISLRVLFHTLVLALCILSLVALWYGAHLALFAAFFLWTVFFYFCLFTLAWHGRPRRSTLTYLIARFRAEPPPAVSPGTPTSRPLSVVGTEQYPFPTDTRGPYLHEPPYRAARGHDDVSTTIGGPRSVETDYDDEDLDEETRQRRIEEEMGRREVSIVTVPKRRLWITNPS
ncbi:hypothetical protein DEU56DRAFT_845972 [Suillus clintonianus]|uniref:uncharacterized protein n=1 Tax=Suillus clintonianus TaxID=1904413 RepID=UPI001B85BA19|nr:uncharacterized protein DEU56DRAFT_845972 [Suillus clintonianus]KAG2156049.1 hypothetical protein DEU56DRAFT_845972 [Suillus clintonianus]